MLRCREFIRDHVADMRDLGSYRVDAANEIALSLYDLGIDPEPYQENRLDLRFPYDEANVPIRSMLATAL